MFFNSWLIVDGSGIITNLTHMTKYAFEKDISLIEYLSRAKESMI